MYLTLFFILILAIILLVDIKQRRILNALTLPAALIALLAGLLNGRDEFLAALGGAFLGFLFFYALYWSGGKLYGSDALGFGDVKLAMLLGAILGIQQVLTALAMGMLLAGLAGALLLGAKRLNKQSTLPYGAFLAFAGIVTLIWTHLSP